MVKGALSAPGGKQGQAEDGGPGMGVLWLFCTPLCSPRVRKNICLLVLVVRLGQLLQGQNQGLSESPTLGNILPS